MKEDFVCQGNYTFILLDKSSAMQGGLPEVDNSDNKKKISYQ
jgi:hypothetical protein